MRIPRTTRSPSQKVQLPDERDFSSSEELFDPEQVQLREPCEAGSAAYIIFRDANTNLGDRLLFLRIFICGTLASRLPARSIPVANGDNKIRALRRLAQR